MRLFYQLLGSFIFSQIAFAQVDLEAIEQNQKVQDLKSSIEDQAKYISLNDAIEEGLRKNFEQKSRSYLNLINEISYDNAFDKFYVPKLQLTMATTSDHFTENLYRDPKTNASSSKTPVGSVGLGFEDYSLFNWGRDYLEYINARESYTRQKNRYKEEKRELRLEIIGAYFNLSRLKNIVRIRKKYLTHTSFIYRLAKEKLSSRKIDSQEFLQAKAMFLDAHKNYHDANVNYYEAQESFAKLIGDAPGTTYAPGDVLKYKPITVDLQEIREISFKNSPPLLTARVKMENAERTYEKVRKDNLPLPKFSLKLGTFQRSFSNNGYEDTYRTLNNSRNVEVAASLNMTWTIYGDGGFLNSRSLEKTFYEKKITEINLREVNRNTKVSTRTTLSRIKYLEKQFNAVDAEVDNGRKVFDKVIDNYISGKTSFVNVNQVLKDFLNASIELENTKLEHLLQKLNLAVLMGVADFPGERFEGLVER